MSRRLPRIVAAVVLATALAAPGVAQSLRVPAGPPQCCGSALVRWESGMTGSGPVRSLATARSDPGTGPAVPVVRAPQAPPDRWFGSDKLRHLFLSFGATGFAHAGARLIGAGAAADRLAPAAAAAAGLAKEISDQRRAWGFSFRDLAWDAAGIAAAMLVIRQIG